ncbi:MAG: hypothetical protein POELPBGB_00919 [Bacteroidia bacterium]|nr:hypothetical protein [Bacteroidia bacterium]
MKNICISISKLLLAIVVSVFYYGCDGNSASTSNKVEEKVPCCCCDGGQKITLYESKKDMYGNSSGADLSRPVCPCCNALKGDYESAKLTKKENDELKRTSDWCK